MLFEKALPKACPSAVSCRCGGPVLSLEYMDSVKQWADAKGVPIHLDGARIFNAAAYLGGCCPPATRNRAWMSPLQCCSLPGWLLPGHPAKMAVAQP